MYDFIVVGGGPAGAAVAGRLARSKQAPKVLLLEAGGTNTSRDLRYLSERFLTMANPDVNWGYKSTPQSNLLNREIDYSRGKGLGGSSTINFAIWTVGPRDDYNRWAQMVGDDSLNWENMQRRIKRLEALRAPSAAAFRDGRYANPKPEDHGSDGLLPIWYPETVERGYMDYYEAMESCDFSFNKDINSGSPIGVAFAPSTGDKGLRWTANHVFVQGAPKNLEVITDAQVTRIILEGKRAVGVVANGVQYRASKEVIVSAGALDSPKLFLLSGIGPQDELAAHGIKCLHHLPGVGKNLRDRPFIQTLAKLPDGSQISEILFDSEKIAAARDELNGHGTGPYSEAFNSYALNFLPADEQLLSTAEFAALPSEEQAWIRSPTVPVGEHFIGGTSFRSSGSYYVLFAMLLCPQSTGAVTLASKDPADPPKCDPNFFGEEFDRVSLVRTLRKLIQLYDASPMREKIIERTSIPRSTSDEDLWEFIQQGAMSTFHMAGTLKMGFDEDKMAVVDKQFRVRGLEGLRVADVSVLPFLLNCHTQAPAYLTGETLAEKLIAEYHLD